MTFIGVLDDWDHKSQTELVGNKPMGKHIVKQRGQSEKKRERSMLQMFNIYSLLIRTFPGLHSAQCINNVIQRNMKVRAVARIRVIGTEILIFDIEFRI